MYIKRWRLTRMFIVFIILLLSLFSIFFIRILHTIFVNIVILININARSQQRRLLLLPPVPLYPLHKCLESTTHAHHGL